MQTALARLNRVTFVFAQSSELPHEVPFRCKTLKRLVRVPYYASFIQVGISFHWYV
jgi:hypothetical protein